MPAPPSQAPRLTDHPGSAPEDIANEPEWSSGHQHRVGYVNAAGRRPGFTHGGDHGYETAEEKQFVEEAMRKYRDIRTRMKKGELVNFQDVMRAQTVSFPREREHCWVVGC